LSSPRRQKRPFALEVAAGETAVLLDTGLDPLEKLRIDDGGHRYVDPLCARALG